MEAPEASIAASRRENLIFDEELSNDEELSSDEEKRSSNEDDLCAKDRGSSRVKCLAGR